MKTVFKLTNINTALVFILCVPGFVNAGMVYSALQRGNWRIYFQEHLASTPLIAGKDDRGDQSAPALSPDGSRVAFEVQGTGIRACFIRKNDPCRVIRTSKGVPVRPVWHPVTAEIAFVNYTAGGDHEDSEIMIADATGAKNRPYLTQTGIQDYPDFSADGRSLAYSVGSTVSLHRSGVQVIRQLWIMDIAKGSAHQITAGSAQDIEPDWSPSGREIAFASDRSGQFEIWVVGANGAEPRQVTLGPGSKTWPAWSPDGKSIMFTRVKDGRQSLWIIDANGTNLRSFEPFGKDKSIELRDADWR